MSIATAPARTRLVTPHHDPTPVELAVVNGLADGHDPETFLWITFRRPDGGARLWSAWTTGGPALGDRIDALATAMNLRAADWFALADRHMTTSTRGRVETQAHPLRPILADLQIGPPASGTICAELQRVIITAADMTGQQPHTAAADLPWLGYGPQMRNGAHG